MAPKYTFKDYLALAKLSARNWFWRVDGKQAIGRGFFYYIFAIGLFVQAISIVISIPGFVIRLVIGLVTFSFGKVISSYISFLIYQAIVFLIFFKPARIKDSIRYKTSVWYQNTGIMPSEVVSDVGVYGEYIATLAAQKCLETNGVEGRVFNNVFVPKKDGDFNEIDIISVSVMGIHVIEAKARTGHFTGNYLMDEWIQNGNIAMKNPLKQNLGHCNYLAEYIYENLPECDLKQKSMLGKMKNVSLWTLYGIRDDVDTSIGPNMNAFCSMSDVYEKRKFDERRLSPQEVNLICKMLDEISHYTPAQRQQMIQQRAAAQERKEYSHPYKYYIVKMEYPEINDIPFEQQTICRDNGFYKSYLDLRDNWFKAIPNAVIVGRSEATRDYDEIVTYFNKINAQSR